MKVTHLPNHCLNPGVYKLEFCLSEALLLLPYCQALIDGKMFYVEWLFELKNGLYTSVYNGEQNWDEKVMYIKMKL